MNRHEIEDEYFEWLCGLVSKQRFGKGVSYHQLLHKLYDTDFVYILRMDENRSEDGIELRRRFSIDQGFESDYLSSYLDHRYCSVLEMMVALALRCEETIMLDGEYGDRTGQWFWGMITSLGLGSMTDEKYDERYVDEVLDDFLNRRYRPDGRGGLFTIRGCDQDLRYVEIWVQLLWYLDSIS